MSDVDLKKLRKSLLCETGDKSYGRYKFLHDLRSDILYLVDEQKVSFASISRSLTNNGHPVSAITVGRYYKLFKKNNYIIGLTDVDNRNSSASKKQARQRNHAKKRSKTEHKSRNIQSNNTQSDDSKREQNSLSSVTSSNTDYDQRQMHNATSVYQGEQQTSTNKPTDNNAISKTNEAQSPVMTKFGKGTGYFVVPDDEAI